MDPFTIGSLALGGVSTIAGLFSKPKGNPNQWAKGQAESYQAQGQQFLDPNNPFYQTSESNFYQGLNKTLNASSPGASQLLASQAAAGGDYGGSTYIAGKQRQQTTQKNADTAGTQALSFFNNLFQQGLGAYETNQNLSGQMYNLFGQGAMAQYQGQESQANNLLGFGTGLIGKGLESQNNVFAGMTQEQKMQLLQSLGGSGGNTGVHR